MDGIYTIIGRLRFHNDKTDTRMTMKYCCHFRHVFISKEMNNSLLPFRRLLCTSITNRNPERTQEMIMSAHKNFVFVLVVVVAVKS